MRRRSAAAPVRAAAARGRGRHDGRDGCGRSRSGRRRHRLGTEIAEPEREHSQVRERRLAGGRREIGVGKQIQQLAEAFRGDAVVLSIERRLGLHVFLLRQIGQQAPAHVAEGRAHARRDVVVGRVVRGVGRHDGFDGLRRLARLAERQQAERAVLIDGAVVIHLRDAARAQAIEGSQGVLVGGGRVQVASGGQRVLGEE